MSQTFPKNKQPTYSFIDHTNIYQLLDEIYEILQNYYQKFLLKVSNCLLTYNFII